MATIANILDRVLSGGSVAGVESRVNARELSDAWRLRPLPNEDIYFYVKRIDNSRVLRQADPAANARGWKILGGASLTATLLICLLLPNAYGLMAGYQMSSLQQENQRLITEQARLDLEEARLMSSQRLQEIANQHLLQSPRPEAIVYLTSKNDQSLALNRQN